LKSQPLIVVVLLVAGLLILSVLLFFANRVPEFKTETAMNNAVAAQGMTPFVSNAVMSLKGPQKTSWEELTKKISSLQGAEKKSWLDSAVLFWDKLRRPDIAAVYARDGAEASNAAKDWFYSGERFYFAVRFTQDQAEQQALYSSAIKSYEQGLKLDPNNTDAKINLAACYVEGTADPMKGIAMLKEIEQTDSNNVKLQLNFAMFSVRSQQWDKAIRRYEKVLQIDSTYIEAWLHLADAYESSGKIPESINALENFAKRTDDPMAKTTISEYILQLKKSLKENKNKTDHN
jgi:tetratricopeptide (TPR) repeat protein